MGVLATGTVVGQLVQVLATPLLTRLYSPAEFGVLAVFIGFLGPLTVIACLRFEMAIPLPRRDGAAYQVVALSLMALLLVTALTALALLDTHLFTQFGSPELVRYGWLLPIGVFLGGFYQLSSMWAIRKKSFGVLAKTRVQQGVGAVVAQGVLGILKSGATGLIVGQIIGQALGVIRLSANVVSQYNAQKVRVRIKGHFWAARRYIHFFKYDALASMLNTAGAQIPAILFAAYFGSAVAGAYLLSVRILSAPITLIGKTLVQALLPDVVAARRSGKLPNLVSRMERLLSALSLGPFLVFAALAPGTFGQIFGKSWSTSGPVAAWTAIWVAFQFTYSPLSVILLAMERQRLNLIIQTVFFVARIAAIYSCFVFGWRAEVVGWYSVVSAVFYAGAIVLIERLVGIDWDRIVRGKLSELAYALVIAAPTAIAIEQRLALPACVVCVCMSTLLWLGRLGWLFAAQSNSKRDVEI